MNELTKAQILDLVTSLYNGEGARTRWGMDRIAAAECSPPRH